MPFMGIKGRIGDPPAADSGDGEGGERVLRELVRLLRDSGGPQDSPRSLLEFLEERRRQRDTQDRGRGELDATGLSTGQKLHLQRLPRGLQAQSALSMENSQRRNALRAGGLDPDAGYARGQRATGKSEADYVSGVRQAKERRDSERLAKRNAKPAGPLVGPAAPRAPKPFITASGPKSGALMVDGLGLPEDPEQEALRRALARMAGGMG